MPLTNPSVQADVYVGLEEQAIRCVIETVMQQRPSLFNYATQGFIDRPELLYMPIAAHPAVISRGNTLLTLVKTGLPVIGTRLLQQLNQPPPTNGQELPKLPEYYSLNFFFQVTAVQVDFSPGNTISMPPGLPTLPEQHFAMRVAVAAGAGFPSPSFNLLSRPNTDNLPVLAPIESVCKFPMEVVFSGYVTRTPVSESPLAAGVDGFEIVDLEPSGLECLIESYVKMELQQVLIPQLLTLLRNTLPGLIVKIAIPHKPDSPITLPGAVKATLTPISATIPHNPAFQSDTVQVYGHLVEVLP